MPTTKRPEKVRLVRPTKRPEQNVRDALRQPVGGEMPSASLIKRARKAWGIVAYANERTLKAIRPKAGAGRTVHAKADAHTTLCTLDTDLWADGVKVVDKKEEPITCLWCLARIKGR